MWEAGFYHRFIILNLEKKIRLTKSHERPLKIPKFEIFLEHKLSPTKCSHVYDCLPQNVVMYD